LVLKMVMKSSDVVLESSSVLESDSSPYFEDSDLDLDLDSYPEDSDSDSAPEDLNSDSDSDLDSLSTVMTR